MKVTLKGGCGEGASEELWFYTKIYREPLNFLSKEVISNFHFSSLAAVWRMDWGKRRQQWRWETITAGNKAKAAGWHADDLQDLGWVEKGREWSGGKRLGLFLGFCHQWETWTGTYNPGGDILGKEKMGLLHLLAVLTPSGSRLIQLIWQFQL